MLAFGVTAVPWVQSSLTRAEDSVRGAHGKAGRSPPALTRDCGPGLKPKQNHGKAPEAGKGIQKKEFQEPRVQARPLSQEVGLGADECPEGQGTKSMQSRGDRTLSATKTEEDRRLLVV